MKSNQNITIHTYQVKNNSVQLIVVQFLYYLIKLSASLPVTITNSTNSQESHYASARQLTKDKLKSYGQSIHICIYLYMHHQFRVIRMLDDVHHVSIHRNIQPPRDVLECFSCARRTGKHFNFLFIVKGRINYNL